MQDALFPEGIAGITRPRVFIGLGHDNAKNGNRYLSWAFVEAANFAIPHYPPVKRFYERKKAKRNTVVAIKAVAHKLARASYYVMRDRVPFDVQKAFG